MPATAAPLRRRREGALHVVKFGGELLDEPRQRRRIARAVCEAATRRPVVVVHGGGREVDAELARFGIPKRTIDGVRITDAATLDIVLGVLAGRVNTRLVAAIGAAGASAIGLTGVDAGMTIVKPARSYLATDGTSVDLGFVGLPKRAARRPDLLNTLTDAGHIPVVASIGTDGRGRLFNVNADTLAADLAARGGAGQLTIAGTTAGVLDASGATIPVVDDERLDRLIEEGQASAGMIAKLLACRAACRGRVDEVRIVDGRRRGALDTEGHAAGTRVTAGGRRRSGR